MALSEKELLWQRETTIFKIRRNSEIIYELPIYRLQEYYKEGLVVSTDQVFHPTLDKWIFVSQLHELKHINPKGRKGKKRVFLIILLILMIVCVSLALLYFRQYPKDAKELYKSALQLFGIQTKPPVQKVITVQKLEPPKVTIPYKTLIRVMKDQKVHLSIKVKTDIEAKVLRELLMQLFRRYTFENLNNELHIDAYFSEYEMHDDQNNTVGSLKKEPADKEPVVKIHVLSGTFKDRVNKIVQMPEFKSGNIGTAEVLGQGHIMLRQTVLKPADFTYKGWLIETAIRSTFPRLYDMVLLDLQGFGLYRNKIYELTIKRSDYDKLDLFKLSHNILKAPYENYIKRHEPKMVDFLDKDKKLNKYQFDYQTRLFQRKLEETKKKLYYYYLIQLFGRLPSGKNILQIPNQAALTKEMEDFIKQYTEVKKKE